MPELEKVVEGLKELRSHFRAMAGISSSRQGRANHLGSARTIEDAIALLKLWEPKPPIIKENSYGWKFYYCPSCEKEFYQNNKFSFCDKCGQAVRWDEKRSNH